MFCFIGLNGYYVVIVKMTDNGVNLVSNEICCIQWEIWGMSWRFKTTLFRSRASSCVNTASVTFREPQFPECPLPSMPEPVLLSGSPVPPTQHTMIAGFDLVEFSVMAY